MSIPSLARRLAVFASWLAAGLVLFVAACNGEDDDRRPPPLPAADVTVRVRVDAPLERRRVSGFLHGLSETQPPDRLVAPLRPALWRSNLERAPLARVERLGARYSVALSGLWGYPMEGWRGRGPPWTRPREWERFVRGLARSYRRESLIWEVWNEPDVPDFWDGGRQRFLRLYALSERILREELGPGAVVGGPSISRYSRSWLHGFLRFCERAGCRPDFLAWHELLPPDQPISSVAEHLGAARRELRGPAQIHVNEYTGPADQYRPGEAVAYLGALEEGGADYAALACWPDSAGGSNCDPGRLDGLIGADGEPRAVWWVHRWYALGAGARLKAASSDARVSVLAGGSGRVTVLLGRGERNPAPERLDVDVQFGPVEGDRFVARVQRVPDLGEAPLTRPLPVSDQQLETENEALRVRVPGLGPHEAALISIERGD